jgi:hypothetical protein
MVFTQAGSKRLLHNVSLDEGRQGTVSGLLGIQLLGQNLVVETVTDNAGWWTAISILCRFFGSQWLIRSPRLSAGIYSRVDSARRSSLLCLYSYPLPGP